MNRFTDIQCPVCEVKFNDSDDVVVCPDCGTPYHRECIKKEGKCVNADKHSADFKYEMPNRNTEQEQQSFRENTVACANCGYKNDEDTIYCNSCGVQLNVNNTKNNQNKYSSEKTQDKPFTPVFDDVFNTKAFFDPMEELDGIKLKDMATFVGENAHYFIPRFKEIGVKPKKLSRFNLAALVFEPYYYMHRKMWGMGIVIFLITLILGVPGAIVYMLNSGAINMDIDYNLLYTVNYITYFLSIAFRGLMSFYANELYYAFVCKKIAKIKQTSSTQEEYQRKLAQQGSSSNLYPILFIAGYLFVAFLLAGFFITL